MSPRRRIRRAVIGTVAAVALTAGGVSAWALNEYVVDHVVTADASSYEAEQGSSGTTLDTSNAVTTATSQATSGTASQNPCAPP